MFFNEDHQYFRILVALTHMEPCSAQFSGLCHSKHVGIRKPYIILYLAIHIPSLRMFNLRIYLTYCFPVASLLSHATYLYFTFWIPKQTVRGQKCNVHLCLPSV